MPWAKQILVVGSLACLFAIFSVQTAKADPLQLSCVSPSCTSGTTTLIVSSNTVTFDYTGTGTANSGDAFIGIIVPDGGSIPSLDTGSFEESVSFGSGDSFDAVLGETGLDSGYNFSNLSSASNQVGVYPNSFTIYEFTLGSATVGHNQPGISNITASNLSTGSIIVGWLETSGKTLQTPLSESITVPEPGTPVLLGFGLLGLLCVGLIRKYPAKTAA